MECRDDVGWWAGLGEHDVSTEELELSVVGV